MLRLSNLNNNTGLNISYKYDINGLRTSKNVSGTSSSYYYTGGKLTYEKRGDHELFFAYDSFGSLNMIRHKHGENTTSYLAVCNSRGDVEALYSTNGSLLATYTYDSWGNVLSIKDANGNIITDQNHIANLNPIRYRGYYYDAETGLYYLKSRYYDPITSRFINADAYMGEIGEADSHNLFAYCLNNPVMYFDPDGTEPLNSFVIIIYSIALVSYLLNAGFSLLEIENLLVTFEDEDPFFIFAKEHSKKGTTNPANRNKHERGQSRKNKDAGGEKGDARRKSRKNKRPNAEGIYAPSVGESILIIIVSMLFGVPTENTNNNSGYAHY